MLVDTMNYLEVFDELMKLKCKIELRQDGWEKKYKNVIRDVKVNEMRCIDYYKLDTNLYFILYYGKDVHSSGFGLIFVFLRNNKWVALKEGVKDRVFGVRMEVYEAHFFERYKQRYGVGDTGIELIFQYFKRNLSLYTRLGQQTHNGKDYKITNIKDGIAICDKESTPQGAIWFYKTYISDLMLKEKQFVMKDMIAEAIDQIKEFDSLLAYFKKK